MKVLGKPDGGGWGGGQGKGAEAGLGKRAELAGVGGSSEGRQRGGSDVDVGGHCDGVDSHFELER